VSVGGDDPDVGEPSVSLDVDVATVDPDRARRPAGEARQQVYERHLAVPFDPRDPEDLASAHRQRQSVEEAAPVSVDHDRIPDL
jgi:hypothetical protein